MSEVLRLMLSFVAGCALGAFFFGGLWWTVRNGMSSALAAVWFSVSLMVRMGVTLLGFYLFATGSWQRMLACLGGFLVARLAVTWVTRRPGGTRAH